jgi:hypothetical protein
MKKIIMFLLIPVTICAQQIANSFSVSIDTAQAATPPALFGGGDSIFAVPNGAGYDVYNRFSGKIASAPITKQKKVFLTVTSLLNANGAWLTLYVNYDTTGLWGVSRKYKTYSNLYNGTTLIFTDSSRVIPNIHGGDCYVYTSIPTVASPPPGGDKYESGTFNFKLWKINIVSGANAQLTKKSIVRQPEATMVPTGLKIVTHSNSDGTTLVQIFDVSGRQTFSGKVPNDKPSLLPMSSLPNSPFIVEIGGAVDKHPVKIK